MLLNIIRNIFKHEEKEKGENLLEKNSKQKLLRRQFLRKKFNHEEEMF